MATTFDGYSHQQLQAMIASIDPKAVQARADQLKKASEDIAKIAEKLKNHVVTGWEGEAATAFQEWVGRAGNATLRLSEYSATGATYMGTAAQKMTEAQAMPKYDSAAAEEIALLRKFHNDPDAPKPDPAVVKRLDTERSDAVRLMNNLAQSYEESSTRMNAAEIPTFPPPPATFVPIDGGTAIERPGGDSGPGSYGRSSSYGPGDNGSSSDSGSIPGPQPQSDRTVPQTAGPSPLPGRLDQEVNVGLDTVGTLPPNPTLPPVTSGPGTPLPTGPGGSPPVVIPPVSLPPLGGPKMVPGVGPGVFGPNTPLPGTSGPLGKPGGLPGLPPRDTGIMGGRQVTTSGPNSSIPRGTVIGEGPQAGRGLGSGMGHAPGVSHGPGGSPVGRRLATEPGGAVGGRQPGAGGRPIAGGQPFTQGGSGLVRNGSGGVGAGAMGHAGAGSRTPGNRRDDQRGDRPDYLVEDEETWQGNRRVAPPVID